MIYIFYESRLLMVSNRFIFRVLCMLMLAVLPIFAQTTDESWKIYDDSELARIDITVNPAYLQWLYTNISQDSEFVASMHFKNKYLDVTMDSIGFRLRGGTSRNAKKKSFKISLNSYIKGTKLCGVEKLNLNGDHNDPSIIRSKLCFDLFQKIGLPAARAAHTQVYINGKFYGLYVSVEQIDENFLARHYADDSGNLWKCLYPSDLQYKDDNATSYSSLMNGSSPVYELSTNETKNDWNPLIRLMKMLSKTSDAAFKDSIEAYIDIADILHTFSFNVMVGQWDDYWGNFNNFYLYHEPGKDKMHIIPYDYDNTFSVDWFNVDWSKTNPYTFHPLSSAARPLIQKILAVPEYKNLYTHFIDFFRSQVFSLGLWETRIDSLRTQISLAAAADSFRTLDYKFTFADFVNSYSATTYSNQHVKMGLKQYINARNSTIPGTLTYLAAKPEVYAVEYSPKFPRPTDSIKVIVSAYGNYSLGSVIIHYKPAGSAAESLFPMTFSPVANTRMVEEADRYIGYIAPIGPSATGTFSIEAKDIANQSTLFPKTGGYKIKSSGQNNIGVIINEFLADNKNSLADPAGEHDDWIELYNTSDTAVKLTGRYMTDNPSQLNKWKFATDPLTIGPHQYLLLWCDEQPTQAGIHTNFKLSKSGEYIAFVDTDGVTILDSLSFGAQTTDISYGRSPDGSSTWSFMQPTPGAANVLTDIKTPVSIPTGFTLNAYPNPFNPSTRVKFTLPERANVTLKVYDILGKEIATLVDGPLTAGGHEILFDAGALASGIYICRLSDGKSFKAIKLQLLK